MWPWKNTCMLQLVATLHGLLLLFPACQSAVAVFHLSTPLVLCMSPESSHANLLSPAPHLMTIYAGRIRAEFGRHVKITFFAGRIWIYAGRIRRTNMNRISPGGIPAESGFCPVLPAESGFCRQNPGRIRILPGSELAQTLAQNWLRHWLRTGSDSFCRQNPGRIQILPAESGRIRQTLAETDLAGEGVGSDSERQGFR